MRVDVEPVPVRRRRPALGDVDERRVAAIDVGHRDVGDHPQPAAVGCREQIEQRRFAAQLRRHSPRIDGVIAVSRRRRTDRCQVNHRDAELAQVRQRLDHAAQITAAGAIALPAGVRRPGAGAGAAAEAVDQHGVDHRVAPPRRSVRAQATWGDAEALPTRTDDLAAGQHEAVVDPAAGAGQRGLEQQVLVFFADPVHPHCARPVAFIPAELQPIAGAAAQPGANDQPPVVVNKGVRTSRHV